MNALRKKETGTATWLLPKEERRDILKMKKRGARTLWN